MAAARKKWKRKPTGNPRGRPRSPKRVAADRIIADVLARARREVWSKRTLETMLRAELGALLEDTVGQNLARRALRRALDRYGVRRRGAWQALPGETDGERRNPKLPGLE